MTTQEQLNQKLDEILYYISDYVAANGYSPSVRDIMHSLGVKSTSSVHSYLLRLKERGDIEYSSGKKRSLELKGGRVLKHSDVILVPVVGRVPAGAPMLALEDYTDTLCLPSALYSKSDNLYILDVEGTSMVDAGINDKDKIIVKQQNTAENGQIVVAMLDDECATVKRFFKEQNHFRLHPENAYMSDIIVDNVTILGIVVGLIRTNIK